MFGIFLQQSEAAVAQLRAHRAHLPATRSREIARIAPDGRSPGFDLARVRLCQQLLPDVRAVRCRTYVMRIRVYRHRWMVPFRGIAQSVSKSKP
jgi:hypothetical protein